MTEERVTVDGVKPIPIGKCKAGDAVAVRLFGSERTLKVIGFIGAGQWVILGDAGGGTLALHRDVEVRVLPS